MAKRVAESVKTIETHLAKGHTMYGVNTGVGTSGDTRTKQVHLLQKSLMQHHHTGILTPADRGEFGSSNAAATSNHAEKYAMPAPWVRAMMLIRCNSLLRGHSGVTLNMVQSMLSLIASDLIPVLPLRGSISASGDLQPLSYLAGAVEGNPDIWIRIGERFSRSSLRGKCLPADQALKLAGIPPCSFGPKEALGIMNGTAASCATASVAIHQARHNTALAHILTAMATEALLGSKYNHDPFIAQIRPHVGQTESAAAMFAFLADSRLVADRDVKKLGLVQDRYPLRTASQWIGPQIEDLVLATTQLEVELNSTTDNPLIQVQHDLIHNGGNFQATSLTNAMSKTLNALQMIGRLMFAQCSELLNSTMNKGLPPNLCFDDPSKSFTLKGVDVKMAAYMSELAYIAHPISSYVQSAEMNNQSINSLALIAARHTLDASKVINLMTASYLYSLCQALDLRCLHAEFAKEAEIKFHALLETQMQATADDAKIDLAQLQAETWSAITAQWLARSSLDLKARVAASAEAGVGSMTVYFRQHEALSSIQRSRAYTAVQDCYEPLFSTLESVYKTQQKAFAQRPTTPAYLGLASRTMYKFIREDLGVPLHQGLVEHPTVEIASLDERDGGAGFDRSEPRTTIGTQISKIHEAILSGRIYEPVMEIVALLPPAGQGERLRSKL